MTKTSIALVIMIFMNGAWASSVKDEVRVSGQIANAVDSDGLASLSDTYRDFLEKDYVSSDYCGEGGGDEPGTAERMKSACVVSQTQLLEELQASQYDWTHGFFLESATVSSGKVKYHFLHFPKLGEGATLSCMFMLDFMVDSNRQLLSDDMDLYCDH